MIFINPVSSVFQASSVGNSWIGWTQTT